MQIDFSKMNKTLALQTKPNHFQLRSNIDKNHHNRTESDYLIGLVPVIIRKLLRKEEIIFYQT